jgi:hypothetical protein
MLITIDLNPSLEKELRVIAEKEGITIELLIQRILEDYVKELKKSKILEI